MTITEFCKKRKACAEGLKWAIGTGCTTMADLWKREDMRPGWREWVATRPGVLTDRELRLYACWCARQIWHLLTDERSRTAVMVAERHADGLATDAEFTAAGAAAWAAWAAAREDREAAWSAGAAARESAGAAAWAAWAAGRSAGAAARAAAGEAREAAGEAAGETLAAAMAAQANYLLNVRPNFEARLDLMLRKKEGMI